MNILCVSIDSAICDPASDAARRQVLYFQGQHVRIIVLTTGRHDEIQLAPGIVIERLGGSSKLQVLVRGILRMFALARSGTADIVTSQDVLYAGMCAKIFAHLKRIPLVVQLHGDYVDNPLWIKQRISNWWLNSLGKWMIRNADGVRCVSERLRRQVIERFGVLPERTISMPICTDLSVFSSVGETKADGRYILFVGRLHEEKEPVLLCDIMVPLLQQDSTLKLVVAGTGHLRGLMEQRFIAANVQKQIIFVGHVPPTELAMWYRSSICLLHPSSWEGWGMVMIEAMACGCPVVTTDTGCAGEAVRNGENSIVTPVGDVAGLREGVQRLLHDNAFRSLLSKAAIHEASRWSIVAHVNDQVEYFASVIRSRKNRRLLVTVQAVDLDDPLMGFFHQWLLAASAKFDHITVLALRVGRYQLPDTIQVIPLRSNKSRSRLSVVYALWHESFKLRRTYDAVFVRGDSQYIALAGWLWRLLGKRLIFWYTHYNSRSMWFWIGVPWAHEVVTAVTESNPLSAAVKIGHHIDTLRYTPGGRHTSGALSILVFGRVSPVKRVDWIVQSLSSVLERMNLTLKIIGAATDNGTRMRLRSILSTVFVWEDRSISAEDAVEVYRRFDVLINATPGSMDKTILEAASCGCVVLAATAGFLHGLPVDLHWLRFTDALSLQRAVVRLAALSSVERREIGARLREWVERYHSLSVHIQKLSALLQERAPTPDLRQRIHRWSWKICIPSVQPGIPILMFHSMDGTGSAGWDATRLMALCTRLQSKNIAVLEAPIASTKPAVVLTVDDATEDVHELLSVLKVFDFPVTIFAPAIAELRASDGTVRRVLSVEELRALVASNPRVAIGGHGDTHESLVRLSDDAAKREVQKSFAYVRSIRPAEQVLFAYPRGKFADRDVKLVEHAGFIGAMTVQPGYWTRTTDPFRIPRLPVLRWMTSSDVICLVLGGWRV